MKQNILIFLLILTITACVPRGIASNYKYIEKPDYKPDLENSLGGIAGIYLVPMKSEKVNFDEFYTYEIKTINNIKIKNDLFEKNKFLIQRAYTDIKNHKIDAIVVYAIKKGIKISTNSLTLSEFIQQYTTANIAQIAWFRKSINYQNFWSVRVPYSPVKTVIKQTVSTNRSLSLFTYEELNSLSKILTKTELNKEYYELCIRGAILSINAGEKNGGFIKPYNGETFIMNIDEVKSLRNLIVFPTIFSEYDRGKQTEKIIGSSDKFNKAIGRALAAHFKSVSLPSKNYRKWYVEQMEKYLSSKMTVTTSQMLLDFSHMAGKYEDREHENAHPMNIIRRETDISQFPDNSAYVTTDIKRKISLIKGAKDRIELVIKVYDVRRLPSQVEAREDSVAGMVTGSYGLGLDTPALKYTKYFSDVRDLSLASYMDRNSKTIAKDFRKTIEWKAKDLDLEFKRIDLNISTYDNIGVKRVQE